MLRRQGKYIFISKGKREFFLIFCNIWTKLFYSRIQFKHSVQDLETMGKNNSQLPSDFIIKINMYK